MKGRKRDGYEKQQRMKDVSVYFSQMIPFSDSSK